MQNAPNSIPTRRFFRWQAAGIFLLLLLAVVLLWFTGSNSNQALGATTAQVRFEGEYRLGSGPWQEITAETHIPATRGDITLRGNFHLYSPAGEHIGIFKENTLLAFYTDHIALTFLEDGIPYTIDHENPLFGASACGVDWTAHSFSSDGTNPIEILIHNPHRFGNENAIDDMLAHVAIWGNIDFEKDILDSGRTQRNIGLLFVVVSFILLGSALFSALLHIQTSHMIRLLGATILSAGIYLAYSAPGVSFWSELIVVNTNILGFSMMFYMLFISCLITSFLHRTKRIGTITTAVLGISDGIYFLLPIAAPIHFYDTWLFWVITQSAANLILFVCLIKECIIASGTERWIHIGMALPIIAFEADVLATASGLWEGGHISGYVFFILFIAALFVVLRLIPESINAAEKAKELEMHRSRIEAEKNIVEAELKESRISLMLSQIRPHFIYNTLGTIERMCLKDPQKAFDLVRNFSLYLRGNFSELDSVTPIRFAEELKHVEYYANIEKVRFPDMNIEYDVEATDFVLPALSVQPLVENAIKHGLMRLECGGTVVIRSYETPAHFCVEVKDNGVGFDTNLPLDEKKHVGLRNIRERLKVMVNGELILESQKDVGTTAIIMIPKEVTE